MPLRRTTSLLLRLPPSFARSERSMCSSLSTWKRTYAAVITWRSTSARISSWVNASSKCFSPFMTILQHQMRWCQGSLRPSVREPQHRTLTRDCQKESASSILPSRRSGHAQSPTSMAHQRGLHNHWKAFQWLGEGRNNSTQRRDRKEVEVAHRDGPWDRKGIPR